MQLMGYLKPFLKSHLDFRSHHISFLLMLMFVLILEFLNDIVDLFHILF
jgi:hypothetical protein